MPLTQPTHKAVLVSIVLALTVSTGLVAAAGTVGVNDQTAVVGEQSQVAVTLDAAPNGVQRYNVTVHLEQPEVASIESAAAGDVEAFQVRARTDDSVTFRAADLSQSVQDGATDVTLGRLTLATTNPGASELTVTVHDFRNDDGEQMNPAVSAGTLTVNEDRGAGVVQSVGSFGARLQRVATSLPGSPPMWAAGGAVIVVILLALVVRRRRTE